MTVWNMETQQWINFVPWMRYCPWIWLTTAQRLFLEEQDKRDSK